MIMAHEEYRTDRYKNASYNRNDQSIDTAFRDEAGLFWPPTLSIPHLSERTVKTKLTTAEHAR